MAREPHTVVLSTPSLIETFIGMGNDCLIPARKELKTFKKYKDAFVVLNQREDKYWWAQGEDEERIEPIRKKDKAVRKRRPVVAVRSRRKS